MSFRTGVILAAQAWVTLSELGLLLQALSINGSEEQLQVIDSALKVKLLLDLGNVLALKGIQELVAPVAFVTSTGGGEILR
jgi:hypothetical protein